MYLTYTYSFKLRELVKDIFLISSVIYIYSNLNSNNFHLIIWLIYLTINGFFLLTQNL